MAGRRKRNKARAAIPPAPKSKPIDRWLGIVGVAVGIIFFLLPKTPLVVVLCAIALFGLLVHPAWNFWWIEKYLWRRITAVILLAISAIIIGYLAWPETQTPTPPSPAFSAEVRSAFVSDSGPMTMYMVGYPSMLGQTASPVFYLAYIQITNLQDVPSTINEFKVAASKEPEGPFEDLVPIPLDATTLYSLGTKTPYPKVIAMQHGTSRLATPMTTEDMKSAATLLASPTLESELAKPIQPHLPISGWVALDSPRRAGLSPGQIYFRITLRDSASKGGKYVVPLPGGQPGGVTMDVNNGSLEVTGLLTDISGFKVKYYSAPFPRP